MLHSHVMIMNAALQVIMDPLRREFAIIMKDENHGAYSEATKPSTQQEADFEKPFGKPLCMGSWIQTKTKQMS